MRKWLSNIIRRLSGQQNLERQLRYQAALVQHLLPPVLQLDPDLTLRAQQMLKREYNIEVIKLDVHKNDIMFHYHLLQLEGKLLPALYSHFAVGARFTSVLSKLLQELQFVPKKIFDFGSGYGRASRFYPFFWPEAEIVVSDVKTEALRFQKDNFGFGTIEHGEQPEKIATGQPDLIIALSVFTHLREDHARAWLIILLEQLAPGGMLIFSFNDVTDYQGRSKGGFAYLLHSEDDYFPHIGNSLAESQEYGHAYMSRAFIKEVVGQNWKSTFLDNRLTPAQKTVLIQRRDD